VKKDKTASKDYYYLYNGHGDVVQMVDTSGAVVNNYAYDVWGNITSQKEETPNPFKYTGEVYDEETGLYYLRARYYDPSIGRFLNEDTYEGQIDNPLSLNLYTYVVNNPLIYSDPSGNDHQYSQNQYNYLMGLLEKGSLSEARWANQQLEDERLYIDKANPSEVLTLSEAIRADANAREDYTSEFIMDTVISAGVDGIVIKGGRSLGKALISKVGRLFTRQSAVEVGFMGGKAAEQYLASTLGSTQSQRFFRTTLGRRFVDVMDNSGIAHESKVGAVSLSSFVKNQILKDAELIRTGEINSAVWHFYRSGVTGQVGPNQSVINFLNANGIKYVIEQVFK
jgi:RHS repeat-associated protein